MEKHIHGGDVYHHQGCIDFSANCNPLGTPEGIKKAIIKSLEHINDYPQVGCTPLKKAIAEYENTKPDQVICGNGAAEVIFSLCRAVKKHEENQQLVRALKEIDRTKVENVIL